MSVNIVNQPVGTIRFRTAKELSEGNHGSLKGNEDFPCVEYKTDREGACKVVVAVHAWDSTEQLVKLSPHGLIETKKPNGRPKRTVHILEENMRYNRNQQTHRFRLDNHMIYKYTQSEVEGHLRSKYADYNRVCGTNVKAIPVAELGDTKKVRLGFTILQAEEATPCPVYTHRAMVLSDQICDWAKRFSVYFVCNPTVIFANGKAIVTVLVLVDLRVSNLQVAIRSDKSDVEWPLEYKRLKDKENLESLLPGQFYVFNKRTLIISLPEVCLDPGQYKILLQQDEKGTHFDITVRYEYNLEDFDFDLESGEIDSLLGAVSPASASSATKMEADAAATNRCRLGRKNSLDKAMDELIKAKDQSFASQADAFDFYRKWNSKDVVHDSLHDLVHFYRLTTLNQEMPYLGPYMGQCKNRQGDNLLHHACRLGKHQFLRSLVRIQCRLDAFNNSLETPLHIAIANKQAQCIDVFVNLLQTIDEADAKVYSHVGDQILKACHMHDFGGHTILHRAVNGGYRELVLAVLRYSRAKNVTDICRIPERCQGNTIAHLAVFKDDEQLAAEICKLEPEAENYTNYRGLTCWQIKMGYELDDDYDDAATDEENSADSDGADSDVEEQQQNVELNDLESNFQHVSIK